jgi:hypothetical protein
MILTIPWNISLKNLDVWFEYEARFGQQNTTIRLWAEKGNYALETLQLGIC